MLRLLLTETGDPPRNFRQRLEKEFPSPQIASLFHGEIIACSRPSPSSMRCGLAPDVPTGRAGAAQVVQHSTAGISCSQTRGAARFAGQRVQGLRPLLHFALAFTLLRDPADAAQLGLGVGVGVSRRLRLTFASDYGRKQHCRKNRGSRNLYIDLDPGRSGPLMMKSSNLGVGQTWVQTPALSFTS